MENFNTANAKKCEFLHHCLVTDANCLVFPIAMLLVFMIFTSNRALQYLSVPVYTIFKNLTVIAIAYGEVMWFGGSVTPLALMSFILMVLSSVIAAWSDFSNADTMAHVSTLNAGYFWMLSNVLTTAMYTLSMRKTMKTSKVNNWGGKISRVGNYEQNLTSLVIYYNNVLTIPVLLFGSFVLEGWSSENLASNFPPSARQSLIVGMIYSGLGAILISYCTAWCIRATSSTTHAMAGALNKLPLAIAGIIFFSDPVTFGGVVAILMGFVSGLIYNVAKSGQKKPAATGILPTSQPTSGSPHNQKESRL